MQKAVATALQATGTNGDGKGGVLWHTQGSGKSLTMLFFAGKLIWQNERWYHRLLHNNTAHALQKRLHWAGRAMVIMPARMH